MGAMASQITSLTIVYSTVYSRRRSKKTSKLRVTGLCEGNSPATGEFPAQRDSNVENVSIWWRHHASSISSNSNTYHGNARGFFCKIGAASLVWIMALFLFAIHQSIIDGHQRKNNINITVFFFSREEVGKLKAPYFGTLGKKWSRCRWFKTPWRSSAHESLL